MPLGDRERTYLNRDGAMLGSGAVLGRRVWDRQHKFRVQLGSLTLKQYESFLPGGVRLRQVDSTGCGSTSVSSSIGMFA